VNLKRHEFLYGTLGQALASNPPEKEKSGSSLSKIDFGSPGQTAPLLWREK
jgi:hypothetical protein